MVARNAHHFLTAKSCRSADHRRLLGGVISLLINQIKKNMSKRKLKVGDSVEFVSGKYFGLTGKIINVDYNSSNANAIYGYYHSVELSNGEIGQMEK